MQQVSKYLSEAEACFAGIIGLMSRQKKRLRGRKEHSRLVQPLVFIGLLPLWTPCKNNVFVFDRFDRANIADRQKKKQETRTRHYRLLCPASRMSRLAVHTRNAFVAHTPNLSTDKILLAASTRDALFLLYLLRRARQGLSGDPVYQSRDRAFGTWLPHSRSREKTGS